MDVRSGVDVNAVIASGWADPAVFPAEEWARAREFWHQRRRHDDWLLAVRSRAADMVMDWTGRKARDVGSFGTRLNLESSDLDLGIGFPVGERERLISALEPHTTFKGERQTRFDTSRLVFAFEVEGVEIDLSALTEEDFAVACRMLEQIDAQMSTEERIAHTWVKHLLRSAGRLEDYAAWKLVVYARFCPEFNWVPIRER